MNVDTDVGITAVAIIETHPDRHDQENWRIDTGGPGHRIEDFPDDPLNESCGTGGCLAGWIAFLDRVKWATSPLHPWMPYGDRVADPEHCTCPPESRFCTCDNYISVSWYAQQRLGLDAEGASALFGPENTPEDLSAGVKAAANGGDVAEAVHRSHVEHNNTKCDECFPGDEDDE